MNNIIGGTFEDAIEKGQATVKNAAKQTVSDFANTVKTQVTGSQQAPNSNPQSDTGTGTNEQANNNQGKMSDTQAKKFLQDLYGSSDPNSGQEKSTDPNGSKKPTNSGLPQNPLAKAAGMIPSDPNKGKSPEDLAKIESLRRQLHGQYYEELTAQRKPAEESVTERIEREDEEKKMELFEKDKKKPPPLPATVKQGTGESVVGMSG